MASESQALNPASVPFFPPSASPGGSLTDPLSSGSASTNFRPLIKRDSATRLSCTYTAEYRSATSSPAGSIRTTDGGDGLARPLSETGSSGSSVLALEDRDRKMFANPSHSLQTLAEDELLIARNSGALDGEETPGPRAIQQWAMKAHTPGEGDHVDFTTPFPSAYQDRLAHPVQHHPTSMKNQSSNSQHSFGAPFRSASPVSSIGSASVNTSSMDYTSFSFDAQLRASPVIRDLMDRMARCELSNREIQRELSDMHTKINILVDRSLGHLSTEPEFKNPFAVSATISRSLTPSGGIGPSPLQPTPPQLGTPKPDDISQLANRINSLQTSVGQLLALQTQQHLSTLKQGLALGQNAGLGIAQGNLELAPSHLNPHIANQGLPGHGVQNRPDLRPSPRVPNPPMRTWSAGTLELPVRSNDANAARPQDASLRDKRRSIANVVRRDSASFADSNSDHGRDSGPIATKWEHLPLAPDLLRSLTRFGVGPPNKIQQRALPFLLKGSDIIAQAPPTQERIAAYVIPAIHIALTHINSNSMLRGPVVVLISTTVDQATQSQRIIRDLGGPIGVRSALGVGTSSSNNDLTPELRLLQQNMPHILCGTPQKLHALFTAPGGVSGADVRFLVLDEVDQLIARNLHEYVYKIVKLLPPPKSRTGSAPVLGSGLTPVQTQANTFDSLSPLSQPNGWRLSAMNPTSQLESASSPTIERQVAIMSNTVPQDVLILANNIQLRDPVRVLVRRDGNVSHTESNQGTKGLRQFYLYLAFTATGARAESASINTGGGHGIIGSGRGAASSAEANQAREWKLDALVDLVEELESAQIIIHVGGLAALDAVVFKLASKGIEAIPLHNDMNAGTKLAALNKFRGTPNAMLRQPQTRVLIVYDVQVKAPDVSQVPLVINYDLPQAVEEYAHRVAPAISNNFSKAGVVVNFVTAAGGDVEMLRSIECYYKIKCPEVPPTLRDLL